MNVDILLSVLIPFLGTSPGTACVFFMKKELSRTVQRALTGFASGVMVANSVHHRQAFSAGYSLHGNPQSEVREEERGEIHTIEHRGFYLGSKEWRRTRTSLPCISLAGRQKPCGRDGGDRANL
ncbi:MAG: hypothetical protein IJV50_03085 [Lachnospiraceae bacterium]|nr:hypothetical protein [Lachnospiraceae bacterium]